MTSSMTKSQDTMEDWSLIRWLITIVSVPITFPWLIYHLFDIIRRSREKAGLLGKVILITGASGGLGEAVAHVFYSCGCQVILLARRKEELERVKNALMQLNVNVPTLEPVVLPLDLTDFKSLPIEVEKILKVHKRIDVLVNNAGISYRGEAATTDIDVDMKIMLVNYFSQIALAKAVIPSMTDRHSGYIVCISSVQGKIAIPYRSAYGASKHALQGWCDSARAELVDSGIQVTVINPGYIKTDLSVNALTGDGKKYGLMDETTQQGYSPQYVADQVLAAVLRGSNEVTVAPFLPRLAEFIRYMMPNFYFMIMRRRARKLAKIE